ncbi:Succinate-semialdehyde dehydrogenase, mitochondrial, partial [Halocaridina rubra]
RYDLGRANHLTLKYSTARFLSTQQNLRIMSEDLVTLAYIGGGWASGQGGQFPVYDPATGEVITHVTDCTSHDVNVAIDAAERAFETWKLTTAKERAAVLLRIRDHLLKNKEHMATILTRENGKPRAEAMGEVGFAASFFEWFAEEGRRMYGETIPGIAASKRFITIRQPVGVAALISPWNFPIGMIGRKVAAALAAGCTCVLKPAEDTPLTALAFAKICEDAGVPCGVINVVSCSRTRVQEVGAALCDSPKVQALSFTGSTAVGQWLYSRCGPTIKKLSLELGGDAPFIVFPTANLDVAVKGAMASKFRNTGQTCVTANRIFIHESIRDEFVKRFAAAMDAELRIGSGLDPKVTQGPIINQKQHDRLTKLLKETITAGAQVVRGESPAPGGLYFTPTLLTGITPKMSIFKEEIFGPIAPIIKFSSEEEVIELANMSQRGLAGFFYSNNLGQIWRVAEAMEVGMVGVNETLFSTSEAPFGGVKHSGLGKEGSKHGLDDFTHTKLICFGI